MRTSPGPGPGRDRNWRLGLFSASRSWLSFQASTVCTWSQERACAYSSVQVSAAVPRGQGRAEGLKRVTREGRRLFFLGYPCRPVPGAARPSLASSLGLNCSRWSFAWAGVSAEIAHTLYSGTLRCSVSEALKISDFPHGKELCSLDLAFPACGRMAFSELCHRFR